MLSQQAGLYRLHLESDDLHALGTGLFTGQYGDGPAGDIERVRKEGDERIVRGSVNRRCCQSNQKGTVPHAIDGAASRSWNNANIDNGGLQTSNAC
jgi:hypothetical protein